MRRYSLIVVTALALGLIALAARAQTIGSVAIDDATDNLTISLDGTDLTGLLVPGPLPPNQTVGTLTLTQGLILTGAGCNNPGGGGECGVLGWNDPNVFTSLPSGSSYASPIIRLLEGAALASDFVSLMIIGRGDLGTQFVVQLSSDGEAGFPAGSCTSITGCVDLAETGAFQDLTTQLLTPVTTCIICTLPTGVTHFSASVRSDVETTVPEPGTLALLGVAMAGWAVSRRKLG